MKKIQFSNIYFPAVLNAFQFKVNMFEGVVQ